MELRESLDVLVAAFNRGSLDVPERLFTPQTAYRLNGQSYEALLGGSEEAPLIRLLARGVAGYRTAAKALQYALMQSRVEIETMADGDRPDTALATLRVTGMLRDTGEPFGFAATALLLGRGGALESIHATCAPDDLTRLAAARRS